VSCNVSIFESRYCFLFLEVFRSEIR